MRRIIAAAPLAALMLGGFVAGSVVSPPEMVYAQEVVDEAPATLDDVLDDLVQEGVITEDQAGIVGDRLREHRGQFRGPARGPHGFMGLETAAEIIGIEVTELAEALRDGQSIAEVAGSDATTQQVVDALVAEHTQRITDQMERLDQAVADDTIDPERAAEMKTHLEEQLAGIEERVTAMVNGEYPEGCRFGPSPGRPGFGQGRGQGRGPGHGPGFGPRGPVAAETGATT